MITGTIKNKIDKIWKDIWASGLTQPITVIEQITYLMFIRSLDQKDIDAEAMENLTGQKQNKIFPETPEGQRMRWSKFKDRDAVEIFDIIQNEVFPFIKEMTGDDETAFSKYMKDASLGFTNPGILSKTINSLDELYKDDIKSLDMQGDLYEYMLSKLSVAGQNGQFRTPKQIRDMMVQLRKPSPDDMICDPACGTAGFLISAAEYIREHYPNMTDKQWELFDTDTFSGFETDPTPKGDSIRCIRLPSSLKTAASPSSSTQRPTRPFWTRRRLQTSPSTHPATATARAASAGSKFSRAPLKARPRTTSRKKITLQAGA